MTQPETQSAPDQGWSPRTLRLTLLASLAVNLLGVGLIVGTMLSGPPPRGEFGLKSFSYTLPEARGQMMRSDFQAHRPVVSEFRRTARQARSEAIGVLSTEPYDAAKLTAALQRLNEAEGQSRQRITEFFLATAAKLTPEERVALGKWWRQHQMRLHHRKGKPAEPAIEQNPR